MSRPSGMVASQQFTVITSGLCFFSVSSTVLQYTVSPAMYNLLLSPLRMYPLPILLVLNDDPHPFGQIIRREMVRVNVCHKAEIYPGKDFVRHHRQVIHRAADAVHLRPDGGCGKSRSLILQPRVEQDRLIAVLDFKRCASNLLNSHGNASVNKQFR